MIAWFLPHFPYEPPACYVTPTKDMMIKPSQSVDASGMIFIPYLHHWTPNKVGKM